MMVTGVCGWVGRCEGGRSLSEALCLFFVGGGVLYCGREGAHSPYGGQWSRVGGWGEGSGCQGFDFFDKCMAATPTHAQLSKHLCTPNRPPTYPLLHTLVSNPVSYPTLHPTPPLAILTGLDIGPNEEVRGVQTFFGMNFGAKGVVLTTGTFMNGRIWVGRASMAAGRAGEAPSTGLTETLVGMGFETDRLKTGTPARVDSRTVNFAGLEEQPGERVCVCEGIFEGVGVLGEGFSPPPAPGWRGEEGGG